MVGCGALLLVAITFFIFSVSAYHRYFHIIAKQGFE